MKIYNTIGHLYYHFLKFDRELYPYIIELFRSDKFFKEIGHRPIALELPSDSILYEIDKPKHYTI